VFMDCLIERVNNCYKIEKFILLLKKETWDGEFN